MLKRLKDNFTEGTGRLKWFAEVFAGRFKVGLATIKLMYNSDEIKRRREKLLLEVGERTYELRGDPEKSVFRDKAIMNAVAEIEAADREINELKRRISEMNSEGL